MCGIVQNLPIRALLQIIKSPRIQNLFHIFAAVQSLMMRIALFFCATCSFTKVSQENLKSLVFWLVHFHFPFKQYIMNQSQIRMGFCSIFTLNVVVMCLLRNGSCLFSFLSLLPDRCILTGLNQYRGNYNLESLSRVLLENAQDSAPSSKYVGMVFWGFICIACQSCKIHDWCYPLWLDKGNRFCGLRGRFDCEVRRRCLITHW